MGLACSGEVADTSFLNLCESSFAIKQVVQRKFGIESYFRFKDDGLIIFRHRELIKPFMHIFGIRAKFFKLEWETFDDECTMLDVRISKPSDFSSHGLLRIESFTKPSSQWCALSPLSYHSPHVHYAWPTGMINRYRALCSNSQLANDAIDSFRRRYQSSVGSEFPIIPRPLRCPSTSMVPRLVLPYHCFWANAGLQKVLAELCVSHPEFRVQVAWKNSGRHLVQVVIALRGGFHSERFRSYGAVRGA